MAQASDKTDQGSQHAEQVIRLENEVEALRRQVRRSQRLASIGTMAAMVAHEFNNILTPIINYAHLAKDNPALTDKAIAKAADGGERAKVICQAILGMSGEEGEELTDKNLAELVSATLSAMVRGPERDGIEVRLNIPEDLHIRTKPIELEQVLLNLLQNAKRAVLKNNSGGLIEISVDVIEGQCILSVADNGEGIAPENIDRIFEPFFSTSEKTDEQEDSGFGLGLTVCQEIIESMDGDISVQSHLGEGTTFTITLPLAA